jgi:hypothetical protein
MIARVFHENGRLNYYNSYYDISYKNYPNLLSPKDTILPISCRDALSVAGAFSLNDVEGQEP